MSGRIGHPRAGGFTLVELLIVVAILGVLAAVAIPAVADATGQARRRAFEADLRDLIGACQLYHQTYGALPPQAAGEPVPAVVFVKGGRRDRFPTRTPLGGYWHVGHFEDIGRWGVGVWWPTDEPSVQSAVRSVDAEIDDGDASAGRLQLRDDARYYWLID